MDKLQKRLYWKEKFLKNEPQIKQATNLFDRFSNNIDRAINLLMQGGEENLNKTFSEKEYEDLIKKFK